MNDSPADAPELFTWEFATDPYPAYAWLREHSPVHRTALPSGPSAGSSQTSNRDSWTETPMRAA